MLSGAELVSFRAVGRSILTILLLAACVSAPDPRPLAEVFDRPEGRLPFRFSFSADGRTVAYLKTRPDQELTDLWVYDIGQHEHRRLLAAEGPEKLTATERADRERRRERTRGISRYWWNPRDDSVLLALSGDLFRLRGGKRMSRDPRSSVELTRRFVHTIFRPSGSFRKKNRAILAT